MKHTKHIKALFAGALSLGLLSMGATTSQALTYSVNFNQTNGTPDYAIGNGGEFTLSKRANNSFFDISAYASTTSNVGAASPSFQTFCIEYDENAGSPLSSTINPFGQALLGGANTNAGDYLSVGTAYLYSEFAQGTLASYTYSVGNPNANGNQRGLDARQLQLAFWYLEDEISNGQEGLNVGTNVYLSAVSTLFGSLANAKADNAIGGYGVWALNNKQGRTNAQDMLYYKPGLNVPDGGTTLMLLGIALGSAGLVRRFLKA